MRWYFNKENLTALFKYMERWAKRLFVGFWKDGLSAELQAKMSRGCRFLLFWHHSYEVTLRKLFRELSIFASNFDTVFYSHLTFLAMIFKMAVMVKRARFVLCMNWFQMGRLLQKISKNTGWIPVSVAFCPPLQSKWFQMPQTLWSENNWPMHNRVFHFALIPSDKLHN